MKISRLSLLLLFSIVASSFTIREVESNPYGLSDLPKGLTGALMHEYCLVKVNHPRLADYRRRMKYIMNYRKRKFTELQYENIKDYTYDVIEEMVDVKGGCEYLNRVCESGILCKRY